MMCPCFWCYEGGLCTPTLSGVGHPLVFPVMLPCALLQANNMTPILHAKLGGKVSVTGSYITAHTTVTSGLGFT